MSFQKPVNSIVILVFILTFKITYSPCRVIFFLLTSHYSLWHKKIKIKKFSGENVKCSKINGLGE